MTHYDTIILGAGAAGLMCATHASKAGGRVLLVDHAKRVGDKIRISGGGRCNFTNMYAAPGNFLSSNPHFAKSALARYSQWDFIELVAGHGIAYHEKTLGQLFCDGKSQAIIDMLLHEARRAEIRTSTSVDEVRHDGCFQLRLSRDQSQCKVSADNLVVATGGKSIPKMGATGIGYQIGEQFGMKQVDTRPGLVPLTFAEQELAWLRPLAGAALPSVVSCNNTGFEEALLFTHRGLSGPAILQISSFWREGDQIAVNFLPGADILAVLQAKRRESGRRNLSTVLADLLPNRVAQTLVEQLKLDGNIADWSDKRLGELAGQLSAFAMTPVSSEGYRTAEVTLGGIDTDSLNSRTMEAKSVPGLYFIGEVVDVTGWLGGFNFQWAWSSGWAAGTAIATRG
ncbi:NAD(P)/FAD-dependent oxidoreductase [Candidatus Halocynthiibacter alkanivorans]|uniref:NAD(P)/FAD-dependent oxidoreductase n=1 Tax=Candidatus Halocynthiibacter alkanivorans TaxID=2267619 RepID=UPI000DF29190|nr:NAD(P)/FAD-dependent oxidoreductase [Candidatus Halocynthiibacter alkanivorans]